MNSKNNNKNFGILFFFVFLIIAAWPILNNGPIRVWSIIVSIIFLLIAFIKPILLKPLYLKWIKLGELLGKIIAPTVMFFIFFLFITPLSFLVKIFGKDLLNLRFSINQNLIG